MNSAVGSFLKEHKKTIRGPRGTQQIEQYEDAQPEVKFDSGRACHFAHRTESSRFSPGSHPISANRSRCRMLECLFVPGNVAPEAKPSREPSPVFFDMRHARHFPKDWLHAQLLAFYTCRDRCLDLQISFEVRPDKCAHIIIIIISEVLAQEPWHLTSVRRSESNFSADSRDLFCSLPLRRARGGVGVPS